MKVDTGLSEAARKETAEALSRLLADTYTVYLKTHGYHWNVTGPMFRSLHLMFEEQYVELALAVDEIAERIRALDAPAPATYAEFARLSSIPEQEDIPEALEMVRRLVQGNEAVVRTARSVASLAEEAGDNATADLASGRIEVHEKTAWMLRATVT